MATFVKLEEYLPDRNPLLDPPSYVYINPEHVEEVGVMTDGQYIGYTKILTTKRYTYVTHSLEDTVKLLRQEITLAEINITTKEMYAK